MYSLKCALSLYRRDIRRGRAGSLSPSNYTLTLLINVQQEARNLGAYRAQPFQDTLILGEDTSVDSSIGESATVTAMQRPTSLYQGGFCASPAFAGTSQVMHLKNYGPRVAYGEGKVLVNAKKYCLRRKLSHLVQRGGITISFPGTDIAPAARSLYDHSLTSCLRSELAAQCLLPSNHW